ncbi:MAG: rRNA maturation RNase YbeY [Bacteroidia bacterium]|nr:rRNA maturation RNase YbeY [Bacteroidia bacterium]
MHNSPSLHSAEIIIDFDSADIDFKLDRPAIITDWLKKVIAKESGNVKKLCYIFCSDQYLNDLNVRYLNHDTFTDVITFPLEEDPIESDIFISIDRIHENANVLSSSFEDELYRVIVHGLLHLLGFGDKELEEKKIMRMKEDSYLAFLKS